MNDDLLNTPKAHAVMKRLPAPRALATVLHAEPAFFEHAQRVADDPALDIWATADSGWGSQFEPPERDIALQLAARYWRGREGRRVVAVFLRAAAAGMRDSDGTPGVVLAHMGGLCTAVWDPTADLVEGDEPNRPGERFFDLVWIGARVIARRGAGRCAAFERGPRLRTTRRSRERRTFCSACEFDKGALLGWHEHAASTVLKRCRYLLGPDPTSMP